MICSVDNTSIKTCESMRFVQNEGRYVELKCLYLSDEVFVILNEVEKHLKVIRYLNYFIRNL